MRPFIAALIIVLAGCDSIKQPEIRPDNIIDTTQMVLLLVDMQLIEGANNLKLFQGDTGVENYNLLYSTVMSKHNVRQSDIDSSMSYYTEHPEELEYIYDRVIEELMKLEVKQKAKQ